MIDARLVDSSDIGPLYRKFQAICQGANFVTPRQLNYVRRGDYICEVSQETCPSPVHMVGVTIVDTKLKKRCFDLDKCFTGDSYKETFKEAYGYIDTIGK